jgi:hypothetical protein
VEQPLLDLLGPDGLTPLPLLARKAGGAARGMFISLPGVVTERLPPAGAAFAQRFARTQPGSEIEPSAIYAAQAAGARAWSRRSPDPVTPAAASSRLAW